MNNNSKHQRGFSLVELMIALVISVATVGGLFSLYLNTSLSQKFTEANSRVQESGRFSIEYLSRDIRMIGYRGCVSNTALEINIAAKNMPANYNALDSELQGYNITEDWNKDSIFENATAITNIIKSESNALSINRMSSRGAQLVENQTNESANITIEQSANLDIAENDIIYISDCINADIFQVTNTPNTDNGNMTITHTAATNKTNNLSKAYQSNATISKYQSRLYFIGDTRRVNSSNQPIFALFQADVNYSTSPTTFIVNELIEGVENMQILYGEVLPSTNIKYVEQANVSEMNNVSSIQLGLLITSQDEVRQTIDNKTYYLAQKAISPQGVASHAADRRLRHSFNSTIQIRNRRL